MKDIIILCVASADVQYALDIFERNNAFARISIYIINNNSIYKYIQSLGLKLHKLKLISESKSILHNKYFLIQEV